MVGISTTPSSSTLAGGILNDVEHEPGLVWPTVTIPAATTSSVNLSFKPLKIKRTRIELELKH